MLRLPPLLKIDIIRHTGTYNSELDAFETSALNVDIPLHGLDVSGHFPADCPPPAGPLSTIYDLRLLVKCVPQADAVQLSESESGRTFPNRSTYFLPNGAARYMGYARCCKDENWYAFDAQEGSKRVAELDGASRITSRFVTNLVYLRRDVAESLGIFSDSA